MPHDFSRATRTIDDRSRFKANEWRTLVFYLIIPILRGHLNELYYENLLKYVLFLRILCQDEIPDCEIHDANQMIKEFLNEYQTLYGLSDMKYNLHAHLHLPSQVWKYGPLNKTSCFGFENIFQISQNLFHGTRDLESQIARNFLFKKQNKLNLQELYGETSNQNIKYFISTVMPSQKLSNKHQLIQPTSDVKLLPHEKFLLAELAFANIRRSSRAFINYKSILIIQLFF